MHCKYVCGVHEQAADGTYVDLDAHAACRIHTLLTLLSGAWVPFRDESEVPTSQHSAPHFTTAADSDDGRFITEQLRKGVELDFWEKLDPQQAADVNECTIIEAGFAALVGELLLRPQEIQVVTNSGTKVDVAPIAAAAEARARDFVSGLRTSSTATGTSKASFARQWAAQGGGSKRRFCVAHDRFLNRLSRRWPVAFPTAYSVLETAVPGDVFITRDHKSGYSVVVIRRDQRRLFCFRDPVTGAIYRCKRLDFGWALSPGIFCAFTAELNAIISSRLQAEVGRTSVSRYYVDDNGVRVTPAGPQVSVPTPAGLRRCSAAEAKTVEILEDVSSRARYPTSPEKVRWGTSVVYLGLLIDSATRSAVVVPTKLFKALTMLRVVSLAIEDGTIDVPVSFMLKVAGSMQWLAQNFRHGRLHTAALWVASERLRTRTARAVTDCPGLHSACTWWASQAAAGLLCPHRFVRAVDIPSLSIALSPAAVARDGAAFATPLSHRRSIGARHTVAALSDAAGPEEGSALGVIWRAEHDAITHAFHVVLSPEQSAWPAICAKELLAIVLWLERFGACYRGSTVVFGTDNAGNVFTVNRLRVRWEDPIMMDLLTRLLAVADACDLECFVWWCPRSLNGIADALSKCPTSSDACRVAKQLSLVLH